MVARRRDAVRVAEEESEGAGEKEEDEGEDVEAEGAAEEGQARRGQDEAQALFGDLHRAPQRSAHAWAARKASLAASAMMSGLIR